MLAIDNIRQQKVWGSLCVLATLLLLVAWYYQTAHWRWTTIDGPSRPESDPVLPVLSKTETKNYTRTW